MSFVILMENHVSIKYLLMPPLLLMVTAKEAICITIIFYNVWVYYIVTTTNNYNTVFPIQVCMFAIIMPNRKNTAFT